MKKTDIAMIVLIASLSMLVAYFVANSIPALKGGAGEEVMVKTADEISPDITDPDARIFNNRAINPTVEVTIGGESSSSALSTP